MDDDLINRIKAFIRQHPPPYLPDNAMLPAEEFKRLGFTPRALFSPASSAAVADAETKLGLQFPNLLKRIYLEISNGIAGFGYDFMGLPGGCVSDCGDLIETYLDFSAGGEPPYDPESEHRKEWKTGLLPFCNWGCCQYSCVDCVDSAYPIYLHDDAGVWPERYTLHEFFEMWLNGNVRFSDENIEVVSREMINPFTREKTTLRVRVRKPRKSSS